MTMEKWLESVYSDGTAAFVSDPFPKMGETVTVRLRLLADAPVSAVFLRSLHNGCQEFARMKRAEIAHGLATFEAKLKLTEERIRYHFVLTDGEGVYYYTQRGITTFIPDGTYDFSLLTDYVQPAWVKDAVFYQIFPERFCNGDPSNDVLDGEYIVDGHPTIRMPSWEAEPLDYAHGRCLDFYGGDLRGIEEKLPYLQELGVTALYLNPIFAGPSVHKYDCVDFFHVDPHFGGDEALASLTKAAHERGMRVILDISINHTGAAHRWFNRDGTFFPKSVGAYNNPDSAERSFYFFDKKGRPYYWAGVESLPTLNYTSEALRDIIYRARDSVLRKWLRPPYSIDGWRFDVADTFARRDDVQLAHELWPEIRAAIREEAPQAYILAEDWGDCAQYLQGSEWDSPMNYFGCARVIRSFFGEPDHLVSRVPELRALTPEMTAEDVKARVTQHLAKLPWVIQENQFNLLDSHDISRFHNDPKITADQWTAAAVFQFMLPGAASIYYGDEADIGGTLGSNEGCRWPMPWGADFKSTVNYRVYSALAHLKAEHKALRRGGMKFLYAQDGVFALARFTGDEVIAAVISNSDRDRRAAVDFASVGAAGPASDTDLLGRGLDFDGAALTVPANSARLFLCRLL